MWIGLRDGLQPRPDDGGILAFYRVVDGRFEVGGRVDTGVGGIEQRRVAFAIVQAACGQDRRYFVRVFLGDSRSLTAAWASG